MSSMLLISLTDSSTKLKGIFEGSTYFADHRRYIINNNNTNLTSSRVSDCFDGVPAGATTHLTRSRWHTHLLIILYTAADGLTFSAAGWFTRHVC